MKKYTLLLFLMLVVLIACKNNKNTTLHVFKAFSDNPTENIEDFITEIQAIPLQTTDSCLINHISVVKRDNNGCWYVYDGLENPLKRFSPEGKFLNFIGQRGQAPAEFNEINEFIIAGDTIHIFDDITDKWLQIRSDNTFLVGKKLPMTIDAVCKVNNNYIVYSESGYMYTENKNEEPLKGYLAFVDKDFKVLKTTDLKDPKNEAMARFDRENFSEGENGNYLYQRDYNDTIYQIEVATMRVTPAYLPDYGAITTPKSYLAKIASNDIQQVYQTLMSSVKYPKYIKFTQSPERLLYSYFSGGEIKAYYLVIYDKTKEVSHIFSSAKSESLKLFKNVFSYDGTHFYSFITAPDFLEIAKSLPDTPLYHNLKAKATTIIPDDNPIIICFK